VTQPNEVAEAHYKWGVSYAHQGNLEQAIMEFKMAIRNAPDWAEPRYKLGIAYGNQGKLDEAIVAWQRAISVNPLSTKAHYNLARAYALKNQKALSITSLQKAIALDKATIEEAKTEKHFDNIRQSPEFQKLINAIE
jgi:tetratricopeptide (TPR) repeat protein